MVINIFGAFCGRTEKDGFHINRPNGEPVYLFLHFRDPVAIVIDNKTIITEPNACIIYSPGTVQEYYSLKEGFVNDYVKFTVSDPEYFSEKNLPLNQIFYVEFNQDLTERISYITWCLTDVMYDHSEKMAEYLNYIMNQLSEIRVYPSPKNLRDNQTYLRLRELRNKIRSAPAEWSVEKMSEDFFLTRSHFSMLYHKHFGVSPREDLVRFRIDYAKKLLLTTDNDISSISELCGYKNCENFIRVFRKQCGITPLQFRKCSK